MQVVPNLSVEGLVELSLHLGMNIKCDDKKVWHLIEEAVLA
jgi:hypothetical protein